MTVAVRDLLDSFEALPESEKHLAVIEILRRTAPGGDLPEAALLETADELFASLDGEESANGVQP